MTHTLVVYRGSERADATLVELARAAQERGARLTVLALVVEEPVARRCCDTRSVFWNGVQREFADTDLMRARMALGDAPGVELEVLPHSGRRVAQAIEREAERRGAEQIVVADPASCGLSRREQRRLRELTLTT